MSDTEVSTEHSDEPSDEPMLNEEWLAAPARRSRLRTVMLSLLVASLFFLGGALTQKYVGVTDAGAAAAPFGEQGPAGGLGGGFPGGDLQGGAAPDGAGLGGGGVTDASGADQASMDAIIGTVVSTSGTAWVVEDLGGKRHRVRVGEETDIVREKTVKAKQVKQGAQVNISGTTSGRTLRADEITIR